MRSRKWGRPRAAGRYRSAWRVSGVVRAYHDGLESDLHGRRPGGPQLGRGVDRSRSDLRARLGTRDLRWAGERRLLHLAQPAAPHVVDEAPYLTPVRDKRVRPHPCEGLAYVLVEIGKGLERERRPDASLGLDVPLQRLVGEREHPAVRVMDEDDLSRAEEPLRDYE